MKSELAAWARPIILSGVFIALVGTQVIAQINGVKQIYCRDNWRKVTWWCFFGTQLMLMVEISNNFSIKFNCLTRELAMIRQA